MPSTQRPLRAITQAEPDQATVVLHGLKSLLASSPSSSPSHFQQLPTIPGYEIIQLIDHGGMSNIYLAQQRKLNRRVAVKMIRPQDSLDDHSRTRFLREASAIAALQHPNVVQIHEIGDVDGILFLCLEYISGGNLEKKLKEKLPLPRESAIIVRQLADAIQAAHDRQIIHRDLKPANVLWVDPEATLGQSNDADSGQHANEARIAVKITDFGLAKILFERSDETRAGYAIGTPSFMSPEQASGHPNDVGKLSDIYGLGAILYELLTGVPPFLGATANDTLDKVRNDAPISPGRLNRSVPRDLERICLQCLEKEPELRYASARELSADLRRFLLGRPVTARPLGRVKRGLRYCAHHPWRALAIASSLLVVIAGITGLVMLDRASSDLKEKDRELEQARANVVPIDSPVAPTYPPDIQNLISGIRENPTAPENARLLADQDGDWLVALARDFSDDVAIQFCTGAARLLLGQSEVALPRFERAKRLAEEQTRRQEGGSEAWATLAWAHQRLGDIRLLQKDREAAQRDYARSIELREMLYQDDPQERRWALELASICGKQAELYVEGKELFTAILLYDRRIGLLNGLLPQVPSLANEIRETHMRMAEIHQQLGNRKAADFHLEEVKRLLKKSPC